MTHTEYETPADMLNGSYSSYNRRLAYAQRALDLTSGGAPPVRLGAATAAPATRAADTGGGDTTHSVEVSFLNAPPGMRTGMTKSEGPAEVSVRTQYSMDNLS